MHTSPWYVLHVIAKHEKRVARNLEVRSVEHYLPVYTERVRWTDRTVVVERPLFPCYVFTRFPPQSRVDVISTPGVLRMLGDDERYLVSGEELAKISAGLSSGLLLRPHPDLALGTRVRVRDGIFAGTEGTVAEFRGQCKVIIILSGVRQCFSLEVKLEDLQVLDKTVPKPGPTQVPAFGY